jgi:hypothetical protein
VTISTNSKKKKKSKLGIANLIYIQSSPCMNHKARKAYTHRLMGQVPCLVDERKFILSYNGSQQCSDSVTQSLHRHTNTSGSSKFKSLCYRQGQTISMWQVYIYNSCGIDTVCYGLIYSSLLPLLLPLQFTHATESKNGYNKGLVIELESLLIIFKCCCPHHHILLSKSFSCKIVMPLYQL